MYLLCLMAAVSASVITWIVHTYSLFPIGVYDTLFMVICVAILWACWIVLEICDQIEPPKDYRALMAQQMDEGIHKWNTEHPDKEITRMFRVSEMDKDARDISLLPAMVGIALVAVIILVGIQ